MDEFTETPNDKAVNVLEVKSETSDQKEILTGSEERMVNVLPVHVCRVHDFEEREVKSSKIESGVESLDDSKSKRITYTSINPGFKECIVNRNLRGDRKFTFYENEEEKSRFLITGVITELELEMSYKRMIMAIDLAEEILGMRDRKPSYRAKCAKVLIDRFITPNLESAKFQTLRIKYVHELVKMYIIEHYMNHPEREKWLCNSIKRNGLKYGEGIRKNSKEERNRGKEEQWRRVKFDETVIIMDQELEKKFEVRFDDCSNVQKEINDVMKEIVEVMSTSKGLKTSVLCLECKDDTQSCPVDASKATPLLLMNWLTRDHQIYLKGRIFGVPRPLFLRPDFWEEIAKEEEENH